MQWQGIGVLRILIFYSAGLIQRSLLWHFPLLHSLSQDRDFSPFSPDQHYVITLRHETTGNVHYHRLGVCGVKVTIFTEKQLLLDGKFGFGCELVEVRT